MIPAMKPNRLTRPAPDRAAALAQYRRRAGFYDLELALLEPLRRRAVALLALRPGEVVLDVGCGTGLSLGLLSQAIGATGRIIGIEQSPEMIELARQRVLQRQLPGVTLLNSPVEIAAIPVQADAALLSSVTPGSWRWTTRWRASSIISGDCSMPMMRPAAPA